MVVRVEARAEVEVVDEKVAVDDEEVADEEVVVDEDVVVHVVMVDPEATVFMTTENTAGIPTQEAPQEGKMPLQRCGGKGSRLEPTTRR